MKTKKLYVVMAEYRDDDGVSVELGKAYTNFKSAMKDAQDILEHEVGHEDASNADYVDRTYEDEGIIIYNNDHDLTIILSIEELVRGD